MRSIELYKSTSPAVSITFFSQNPTHISDLEFQVPDTSQFDLDLQVPDTSQVSLYHFEVYLPLL